MERNELFIDAECMLEKLRYSFPQLDIKNDPYVHVNSKTGPKILVKLSPSSENYLMTKKVTDTHLTHLCLS